jgi:hypothetical protein
MSGYLSKAVEQAFDLLAKSSNIFPLKKSLAFSTP